MTKDSGENKGKEVFKMGVMAKPINIAFSIKPEKTNEFIEKDSSKSISTIKKQVENISNISVESSVHGKR